MEGDLEYPYRARQSPMILAVVLFGVCFVFLAWVAVNNAEDSLLFGMIKISLDMANLFYSGAAAVSLLLVAISIAFMVRRARREMWVRLTPTGFSAPENPWAREPTWVPLREIEDLYVYKHRRREFIELRHRRGKLIIPRSALPGGEAFGELHRALVRVTRAMKHG